MFRKIITFSGSLVSLWFEAEGAESMEALEDEELE